MTKTRPLLLIGALCVATLSLGACSDKDAKGGNRTAEVGYVVVRQEPVPVTTSLGGRTVAFETSEVRPQVNGVIRRRLFTEGGFVRAGQPLYQSDASLYQAAVDQARQKSYGYRGCAGNGHFQAPTFRGQVLQPAGLLRRRYIFHILAKFAPRYCALHIFRSTPRIIRLTDRHTWHYQTYPIPLPPWPPRRG